MPRSRSRSRSGSFGRNSAFASKPASNHHVTRSSSPGILSGMGSTLAHGMAFGAGSEVAHQAVRGIMGPNYQQGTVDQTYQEQNNQQKPQNICEKQINKFAECIKHNEDNIGSCQEASKNLKECKTRNNL